MGTHISEMGAALGSPSEGPPHYGGGSTAVGGRGLVGEYQRFTDTYFQASRSAASGKPISSARTLGSNSVSGLSFIQALMLPTTERFWRSLGWLSRDIRSGLGRDVLDQTDGGLVSPIPHSLASQCHGVLLGNHPHVDQLAPVGAEEFLLVVDELHSSTTTPDDKQIGRILEEVE